MNIKTIFDPSEQITFNDYMVKCGIKDIEEFCNPTGKYLDDCLKYVNMLEAVQMAKYHILNKDAMYILSDSGDTDGITSAYICYDYLKLLRPELDIKILIHEHKERGLQDDKLFERIKTEPRPLVIIPDSGSNNCERAKELSDMNISILVLDHHTLITPIQTGVLVNNQVGDVSPYGSGCLVTHKFLQALDREFGVKYSSKYIDVVALSLVSDVMNMSDLQNRTYYKFGLETRGCIRNNFLNALFDKFIGDKPYTQRDIAFKIVPKLNSVSRCENQQLKQYVFVAFMGLYDVNEVADMCGTQHGEQTRIVAKVVENIKPSIDYSNKLIIVADDSIPKTYAGLIASKLSDNHPIVVGSVKDGELIGSFRSPVDIDDTLVGNPLINWKQGHSLASGISLPSDNIQPLIDYYNTLETLPQPKYDVLGSYTTKSIPKYLFAEFDPNTDVTTNAETTNSLYGKGFPNPLIHIHSITVNQGDMRVIVANGRTLKLLKDGIEIMWFMISNADKEALLNTPYELELVGTMGINTYGGKKTPQIIVEKYEISDLKKKTLEDIF